MSVGGLTEDYAGALIMCCHLWFLLAYRGCEVDVGQEERCDGDMDTHGGMTCSCKADLCNTGVQSVTVGHVIILSCVTVTAVVGRIFNFY